MKRRVPPHTRLCVLCLAPIPVLADVLWRYCADANIVAVAWSALGALADGSRDIGRAVAALGAFGTRFHERPHPRQCAWKTRVGGSLQRYADYERVRLTILDGLHRCFNRRARAGWDCSQPGGKHMGPQGPSNASTPGRTTQLLPRHTCRVMLARLLRFCLWTCSVAPVGLRWAGWLRALSRHRRRVVLGNLGRVSDAAPLTGCLQRWRHAERGKARLQAS
jgi:hypothetical protein